MENIEKMNTAKVTDAEIMKALEWCEHFENNIVLKGKGDEKCVQALQVMGIVRDVLKDYERQKAEIEEFAKTIVMLDEQNKEMQSSFDRVAKTFVADVKKIKSEVRKEFAERLKEHKHECGCNYKKKPVYAVTEEKIDNLLEELEGNDG